MCSETFGQWKIPTNVTSFMQEPPWSQALLGSSCPWTTHQDHRPSWKDCWCLQEALSCPLSMFWTIYTHVQEEFGLAIAEHLHQTILDLFSFLWMGFKHLNCLSFFYYFLYGNIFIQMFCNIYFISLFYLIEFWALLFWMYSWRIKV